MARKGNQQKNGLGHHSSNNKKGDSDMGSDLPNAKGRGTINNKKVVPGEELTNGDLSKSIPLTESVSNTDYVGNESKIKQKSGKFLRREKPGMDASPVLKQPVIGTSNSGDSIENTSTTEAYGSRDEIGTSPDSNYSPKDAEINSGRIPNRLSTDDMVENTEFPDAVVVKRLRDLAIFISKASSEWIERHKPMFNTLKTNVLKACDYVRTEIEHAYPICLRWIMNFGNIMLLLSIIWLDCTVRGIDSFLRMGTALFFTMIWCSLLSIIPMIGIFKFLMVLALGALMALLAGFTIALLFVAISGSVILWLYGSFWTTALVIVFGGLAFMWSHERLALFITTMYSVYCAWTYGGWLGLLLGFNLSFISSDALIYFLRNNVHEHRGPNRPPEQAAGMGGQSGFFSGDPMHGSPSDLGSGPRADRSPGVPSTSGSDSEITSDEEVVRLLNCTDHYSAMGFLRFENVDVSILKREYRKKAMLVHPDKNMGNEKAVEAFKKLQNAYEVLLDSFKRKAYDDELRREELLNCFRRFQNSSQKTRGGFFAPGFARTETDGEDPVGESRRIACRKCAKFHLWVQTKKSKSRARWCQECKDFHPAKDGDGWVEQSSQPLFFGILHKVDAPSAYVCADGKIYDATEWYICQGMKCPVNTHKPSFHANTSLTSKHNSGKGMNSGQRCGGMPTPNMEESMTEEEFIKWLQNAVKAGVFDNFASTTTSTTTSESPSPQAGSSSSKRESGGGGGGGGGGSSGSKKKKKGKKQR